jgi:protein arginine N-methyltransferase 1
VARVWKQLAELLDHHRQLVDDTERCETFYSAISQVVRPGDVVLDIGAGTGLLSLFACQAGAKKVHAVETGVIADVAEELFASNGCQDRVSLFRHPSTELVLPERVDVVVSESLWNFGIGEGITRAMADARRRLLKPRGRLIPEHLSLRLAPVENPELEERLSVWARPTFGVDLSRVAVLARNNVYHTELDRDSLLAAPETLSEITLGEEPEVIRGVCEFVVRRRGTVHGLGGWFDARLCGGLTITNQPPSPTPSWKHAFFPVSEPIDVRAGDLLRAELQCVGNESAWRWAVRHYPASNRTPARELLHSTLRGFPTALERAAQGERLSATV